MWLALAIWLSSRPTERPTVSVIPRFAMAPLEETTWNLVWVAGTPVPAAAPATAPTLTFRRDSSTFSANGGCNRLAGRFEARGASLAFATAGTLTACPGSAGSDSRLKAVLANTRMYRILGHSLELYDDQGKLVARFEG